MPNLLKVDAPDFDLELQHNSLAQSVVGFSPSTPTLAIVESEPPVHSFLWDTSLPGF